MSENKNKTYEALSKLGVAVFNADGAERSFNEVMQDLSDLYQKGIELDLYYIIHDKKKKRFVKKNNFYE